jgi:hypothetical protein
LIWNSLVQVRPGTSEMTMSKGRRIRDRSAHHNTPYQVIGIRISTIPIAVEEMFGSRSGTERGTLLVQTPADAKWFRMAKESPRSGLAKSVGSLRRRGLGSRCVDEPLNNLLTLSKAQKGTCVPGLTNSDQNPLRYPNRLRSGCIGRVFASGAQGPRLSI